MFKKLSELYGSKLVRKGVATFLVRSFGLFVNYVWNVLMARTLKTYDYGIISITNIVLNFFYLVGKYGFDIVALKLISPDRVDKDSRRTYNLLLVFVLVFSAVASILLFFTSSFIAVTVFSKPHMSYYFKIISISLPFMATIYLNAEVLRAKREAIKYSVLEYVLVPLFGLVTLLISFGGWMNARYMTFLLILCYFLTSVVSFWMVYEKIGFSLDFDKFNNKQYKRLLRLATPFFLGTVISFFMNWIDRIIISSYGTEEDAAIYGIAAKIAILVNLPIDVLGTIFVPFFADYYKNKEYGKLNDLVRKVMSISIVVSVPFFILFVIFPTLFLGIFGTEYLRAANTLRILALANLSIALTDPVGGLMQMTNKHKIFTTSILLCAVMNLVLSMLFVPKFGYIGAASTTAFSYIVWRVWGLFYIKKKLKIKIV